MKKLTLIAVLSGLLLPARSGYCWDKIGHMVVAQIAYDTLQSNKADAGVVKTLDGMVDTFNHSNRDPLGRLRNENRLYSTYNAVTIAAWMDDLKEYDGSFNGWHSIGLQCDATRADVLAAPAPNAYAALSGKGIDGQGGLIAELGNKKLPAATRARALAELINIESDLHEPFHTVAMHDGGAQMPIMLDPMSNDFVPTNLRFLWDCGYRYDWDVTHAQVVLYDPLVHGESSFIRPVKPGDGILQKLAREIMAANPPDNRVADLDPASWALESNGIACNHTPPSTLVTPTYIHTVHDLTWERLALAGYRLAAVLRSALG